MSLNFNKLKSFFVVSDPEPQKETAPENKQENNTEKPKNVSWKTSGQTKENTPLPPTPPITHASTNTSFTSQQPEIETGSFNQQIYDSLMKAVHSANLPGEDYLEFMSAINAMKDIPLDEKVKIQSVIATLGTKGLTLARVFESADYYIKVLENEKTKFYEAVKAQTSGQIIKKQSDLTELEKMAKKKAEQIQLLTEEIAKISEEINKVQHEIMQADNKIKSTENSFVFTFETAVKEIKTNIANIQQTVTK